MYFCPKVIHHINTNDDITIAKTIEFERWLNASVWYNQLDAAAKSGLQTYHFQAVEHD